jgi:dUTP pyrophosphatase
VKKKKKKKKINSIMIIKFIDKEEEGKITYSSTDNQVLNKDKIQSSYFSLRASLKGKEMSIPPMGILTLNTGITVNIPIGYEGEISSRRGLIQHFGVIILSAPYIINENHKSEIKITLQNNGRKEWKLKDGEEIALLRFLKSPVIGIEELVIEKNVNNGHEETKVGTLKDIVKINENKKEVNPEEGMQNKEMVINRNKMENKVEEGKQEIEKEKGKDSGKVVITRNPKEKILGSEAEHKKKEVSEGIKKSREKQNEIRREKNKNMTTAERAEMNRIRREKKIERDKQKSSEELEAERQRRNKVVAKNKNNKTEEEKEKIKEYNRNREALRRSLMSPEERKEIWNKQKESTNEKRREKYKDISTEEREYKNARNRVNYQLKKEKKLREAMENKEVGEEDNER